MALHSGWVRYARSQERASPATLSLTVSSDGSMTAGIDVDAIEGLGDTGNLSDDLTDLLVALGEAAQERETGVAFLVDEVQFLKAGELEALIAGLHRVVQKQLPITLVGAGLPQLPRLAGEAKSYAERLFKFPRLGRLSAPQAEAALAEPAARPGRELRAGRDRRDRRLHRGLPLLPAGVRQDRLGSRSGRRADQPGGSPRRRSAWSSRSSTNPSSACVPSGRRSSSCTTSARWPSSAARSRRRATSQR